MGTTELIKQINKLPVSKRLVIVNKTLKSIKDTENKNKLKKAADELLNEYTNNKELTIFTKIDFENFYEAR